MKLSGKSKSKKKKSQKTPASQRKMSAKSKVLDPQLDPDDEVLTADTDVSDMLPEQARAEESPVIRVEAFEGGFVHPCIRDAVNAHWRKSAETNLLMRAMTTELTVSGAFFGSVYVKTSFMRKTGGSAIL